MASTKNEQLRFGFMSTTPEVLSPRAEYAAYLRSVRDEKPSTLDLRGGNRVAKTKRPKVVLARRKI